MTVFPRKLGSTEMVPEHINGYFDTLGPQTFDRPVMLSFSCASHPTLGNYATFDIMLTWEQVEQIEAQLESVRRQCTNSRT